MQTGKKIINRILMHHLEQQLLQNKKKLGYTQEKSNKF